MRWLIFSYELSPIVKQCDHLLQDVGQTVIHHHHHGNTTLQEIKEQIYKHKPERVIVITNENICGNKEALVKTLRDHLMIPVYVSQATMNPHSSIPVLLLAFTNENDISDPLSSNNIIQNATNELISIYQHIVKYVQLNFCKKKLICFHLVQDFLHQLMMKN